MTRRCSSRVRSTGTPRTVVARNGSKSSARTACVSCPSAVSRHVRRLIEDDLVWREPQSTRGLLECEPVERAGIAGEDLEAGLGEAGDRQREAWA